MKHTYKAIQDFDSLIELVEYFNTEKKCIDFMQWRRWGDQVECPHCECKEIYKYSDGKRFKCAECMKQFTVRIGTIFEDSKVSFKKWIMAIYLLLNHKTGISSHQLGRSLKVTQKTAWYMIHRIRFGVKEKAEEKLDGRIELDETFVGGKNKNRHKDKKVEKSQGRSFKDKTPIMGMLQEQEAVIIERPNKLHPFKIVKEKVVIKQSKVVCLVIPNTQAETLQPAIGHHVKAGSVLISDEWMGYNGLNAKYDHRIVDHRAKQYVNEAGDTSNALEGFWQGLKLAYYGVYRHYSRKHSQAYANEAAYRYNTKHMSDGERVKFAISLAMTHGKLSYKQLIQK